MHGRALLGWNLRRIRVGKGLSQEKLAYDSGVDRAYVGGIEREQENPTVDLLERLAKTLDVPIAELFRAPKPNAQKPKPLPGGRRRTGR